MSTFETTPLNPPQQRQTHPEPRPFDGQEELEIGIPGKGDPLYVIILYGISLGVSIGGLGAGLWGYYIVCTAPLDEPSSRMERESYEQNFFGMQSVLVLLTINILWCAYNFQLAYRSSQQFLWVCNMAYDFFLWALLIAFGVLNMVQMLWDRRLCDGWKDKEAYMKCDIAMFRLLVVEMVAVNLGLLVAVVHFILLIVRCCSGSLVKNRIQEEEQYLLGLVERRRILIEETEALEARRSRIYMPLPPLPHDDEQTGGDLIDIAHEEASVEPPPGSPSSRHPIITEGQ